MRYGELCRQIARSKSAFIDGHQNDIQVPGEEIQKRVQEREPFLDIENLAFREQLLRAFLDDFLPLLEKYGAFDGEEIARFAAGKAGANLAELARSILSKDLSILKSWSKRYLVGTDFALFVGLNLTQALLELYGQKLKDRIDQEGWLKGICPVCGSRPSTQRLRRDDGRRMLRCSLCASEWHFKRIMCPFCENEDYNTLRYFFVDESSPIDKPAFRVDVCDKCKSYIKTLDERKLPESEKPDLYVENLSTLYLDMLAQRDGYKSPTYWMIGPSEDLFV